MASIRPFLFAAALPLTLVACGGDDGGGTIVPEGEHYHYVAKKAYVPSTNVQATEWGLDLDGNKTIDNQLGKALASLTAVAMFDIQGTIDQAVAEGSIILLMDFQTKAFDNTTAAGLTVLLGENPMPAACNPGETWDETTMMGCGHHLTNGSFGVSANSPTDAVVGGKVVNGTFEGGPGNISLQIALGSTQAIQLDLIGARAKAAGVTADALPSVILGGALTEEELNNTVIPAIHAQLAPTIMRDCGTGGTPPGCNCPMGSTGAQILGFLDSMPADCTVTVDEIKNNGTVKSLLSPDVDLLDASGKPGKDGTKESLSIGIKVEGTKATFTFP